MATITPRRSLADGRHLIRFLKSQAGADAAAIAKQEGVSLQTVRQSISQMEIYRKKNTQVEFELAIRDLVISTIPQTKQTLQRLLTATEIVEVKDQKTGKTKYEKVEDKTTRIEAVRLTKELIVGMIPKGPPVEVNVNNTTQIANMSAAETNEERMRRLRANITEFNKLPPEVAGVPTHIDREEEPESTDDEDEDDDGDEEEEE